MAPTHGTRHARRSLSHDETETLGRMRASSRFFTTKAAASVERSRRTSSRFFSIGKGRALSSPRRRKATRAAAILALSPSCHRQWSLPPTAMPFQPRSSPRAVVATTTTPQKRGSRQLLRAVTPPDVEEPDYGSADCVQRNAPPRRKNKKQKKGEEESIVSRRKVDGKQKAAAGRTQSFDALHAGNIHQHIEGGVISSTDAGPAVEPHTLILGTHPSIASLSQQQYYGHPMK